jgi:hypothetical protein
MWERSIGVRWDLECPLIKNQDAHLLLLLLVPVFAAIIHYSLHHPNFIYFFTSPFFGFCKNLRWKSSHLRGSQERTIHVFLA